MRILIVTDAWKPQVNGVVRTLESTRRHLTQMGHQIQMITPLEGKSIPCPTYSEISLVLSPKRIVREAIEEFRPEAIHIATEGPLGWAARSCCRAQGLHFTTSFHTQFPEYIQARTSIPPRWTYKLLCRFHSLAQQVMVNTSSMQKKLSQQGFQNLTSWSRGVDTHIFKPQNRETKYDQPVLLYVGRVAVEKNLEDFLNMDMDAIKIVVGDGPARPHLEKKFPDAHFMGAQFGESLVSYYSMADAFVFPSCTDTFGLVMLEALACGTPVAAYPIQGPIDVIQNSQVGCLDNNLKTATLKALGKSRSQCRSYALNFSWEKCTRQFFNNLTEAC